MKNLFLLLTCLSVLTLQATTKAESSVNETKEIAAVSVYVDNPNAVYEKDGSGRSYAVSADIVLSEAASITFRFVLANASSGNSGYYSVPGYSHSMNSNGQYEVTVNLPAGRSRLRISRSGTPTCVINVIKVNGENYYTSPLVL